MNQYLLAAIEFTFIGAALFLLFPILLWKGMLGLFFAFVGFELHLIWHRRDRETKAAKKQNKR
ncbi:MAG: hypothetical protein PHO32_06120 [Candidatus Cloacimonetes bacterium]|nr:hypothetical protein [Candidatus Cloacimonadota bacterium]